MKRILCLLLILLLLPPCGLTENRPISINLSAMNNLMGFAMAKSIIESPEAYVGKRIKVTGWYTEWLAQDGGLDRFMIVVDLNACCFNDGSIHLKLLTDSAEDFVFPAVEQQFEAIGVVEKQADGVGALRLEEIKPLDHWQSEVYW